MMANDLRHQAEYHIINIAKYGLLKYVFRLF